MGPLGALEALLEASWSPLGSLGTLLEASGALSRAPRPLSRAPRHLSRAPRQKQGVLDLVSMGTESASVILSALLSARLSVAWDSLE